MLIIHLIILLKYARFFHIHSNDFKVFGYVAFQTLAIAKQPFLCTHENATS